jgi:hypothetical protein
MANKKGSQRTSDAALAMQLIAGTEKHLAKVGQLMIAGGTFTPDQATSKLQSLANLRSDVVSARANTKAKIATEKADAPALRLFMEAFVSFVKAAFSNAPDVLADFGLSPKKVPPPKTAEQKAAAAAKRKATRAARGVLGSQQRKAVKGDVTGITVTPIVAQPPATQGNGAQKS